jgi:hypothetical protein
MSSLAASLALLEAERADLARRVSALDAAIASIRSVAGGQVVNDPAPVPARKIDQPVPPATQPKSPPARPLRRMFTASAKRAGADLGRDIGAQAAAEQLDLDPATIEGWMRWFPAETESTTATAAPAVLPELALVAPIRGDTGDRQLGTCSCGAAISDADAWALHNQAIPSPVGHRLVRHAS